MGTIRPLIEFGLDAAPSGDSSLPLKTALEACRIDGGGVVVVPSGEWTTGPIHLPDNTMLRLETGSVLRFRDDPSLYPPTPTRWEGVECHGYQPCIYSQGSRNVGIEGDGVIDGGGPEWWRLYRSIRDGTVDPGTISGVRALIDRNRGLPAASGGGGRETGFLRPPLIQFHGCEGVLLDGITFRDSPFWNTHILFSRNVTVRNCRFVNPPDSPNTDGMNIDSSSHVLVENCEFDVGDDCLCLKSGSDADGRRIGRPAESVRIRDCVMRHGHGGIVFGSEISGGIRDIHIERCRFEGTDRGIRIKARRGRGGFVRDVEVSDVVMTDVPFPFVANLYYRCGISEDRRTDASDPNPRPVTEETPTVSGLVMTDVRASGVSVGLWFGGLPESPVTDVSVDRWDLRFDSASSDQTLFEPAMDFRETGVPRGAVCGSHVRGMRIRDLRTDRPDIPIVSLPPHDRWELTDSRSAEAVPPPERP